MEGSAAKKQRLSAQVVDGKVQKACAPCRNKKLRCVLDAGATSCVRCLSRGELCRFKLRSHDEKWQEDQQLRVESLEGSLAYLLRAVATLSEHLGVVLPLAPLVSTPGDSNDNSPRSPKREPVDYSTLEGTASLLAHSQLLSNSVSPSNSISINHDDGLFHPPVIVQGRFSGLLDDIIREGSPDADGRINGRSHGAGRRMSLAMGRGEGVGSEDPRIDCVKAGIVDVASAEILVDFFHAHLAPHLMGFPLQHSTWPFLASKSKMTPLILGVTCLISSTRIPQFQHFVEPLENFLSETVLGVEPGRYFVPGALAVGEGQEPPLDLELGIGPEEISALAIYAALGGNSRSWIIARTAFEWTRGYLKTYMVPCPITYGEALGILPARRDLTFENWLRLWLFSFTIDVQQSLHHETPAVTVFDPLYFCDTLSQSTAVVSEAERERDRELIAHARLCKLIQEVQGWRKRRAGGNHGTSLDSTVAAFERWGSEVDKWWTSSFDNSSSGSSTHHPPSSSTIMALTLFGLFTKLWLAWTCSQDPVISTDPIRWRLITTATRAARDLLRVVLEEPYVEQLSLLLPFYVKMITFAGAVVLGSLQYKAQAVLPLSPKQACDAVHQVAHLLATCTIPRPDEGARLMQAVDKMRATYVNTESR